MENLTGDDPRAVGGYRLLGRLGQGGMGRVYLAQAAEAGGGHLALKVIHPAYAQDEEFRRRFRREVRAAARVRAPGVARVLDADADAQLPWLATEFIPGLSLAEAIAEHGSLPVPACRRLAGHLVAALRSVHGEGLVHRDLKPSNVLLGADGARLIDFGIARAVDDSAITHTGQIPGTPGYIAPEVLRGADADARSDVFALGAVLAFAARGSHPYGTGPAAVVLARPLAVDPDLSGIADDAFADVLRRCLAMDPADRPTLDGLARAAAAEGRAPTGFWVPATLLDVIGQRSLLAETLTARGPGRAPGVGRAPAPHRPTEYPAPGPHDAPTVGATVEPAPAGEAGTSTPPDHKGLTEGRTEGRTEKRSPTKAAPKPPPPPRRLPGRRTVVRAALAVGAVVGGGIVIDGLRDTGRKSREQDEKRQAEQDKEGARAQEIARRHKAAVKAAAVPLSSRLVWDQKAEGGLSAPSLSGSELYVRDTSGSLRALKARSGAVRWSKRVGSTHIQFALVAIGDVVAVMGSRPDMTVHSARDGSLLWTAPRADSPPRVWRGNLVYDAGYAIRCVTTGGSQLWNHDYGGPNLKPGPLITTDDTAVLVRGGNRLIVVSLRNGSLRWDRQLTDGLTLAETAVSGDTVIVHDEGKLTAFDLYSGSKRWSTETPSGGGTGPVSVRRGVVYAAAAGLYACSLATGKKLWHARRGPGRSVLHCPRVPELVFGHEYSELIAVRASNGSVAWRTVLDSGGAAGSEKTIAADSALYGYADTGDVLACVDARTGRFRWTIRPVSSMFAPVPTPAGLVVAGPDGLLCVKP
ncbi:PQQ-binding-like beta-propeller repeat protein [Streptomyces sp. NPDC059009]|uniref:protein kinase domain-containing protein n=1 Tax=Streptomyces sp. NPDC059009 TaxID=3346694 RepID=UPI0036AB6BA6